MCGEVKFFRGRLLKIGEILALNNNDLTTPYFISLTVTNFTRIITTIRNYSILRSSNDMNGMIGVREAHKQSNIPYETIYRAAKDGRINGAMQMSAGKIWIFPKSSFENWASNDYRPQNRTPTKEK